MSHHKNSLSMKISTTQLTGNKLTNMDWVYDCKLVTTPTMKFGIAKLPQSFYKDTEKKFKRKKKQ